MENIVGQPPRGKNFFPRSLIINRIYRRLESGSHLYLSAPRRSGKTSIMRALEDSAREGFIFVYVDVEDCDTVDDYFRMLAEELETSEARGKLSKLGEKAKGVFERFLARIRKIKVAGVEVETSLPDRSATYAEAFEALLRDLETERTTVVIMVDEFPVAVENIAKTQSVHMAVRFLHANRAMRQRAPAGIRFIYTGSIGLPNVARKLDPAPTINDLNIVEIPPLTPAEGLDMSGRIFREAGLNVDESIMQYMLQSIDWLMPFFIQLVIQLLIEDCETDHKPVSRAMVDKALQKATHNRHNAYLATYHDRLAKSLSEAECATARAILGAIAEAGSAAREAFSQPNAHSVLETLEYDGYIHEHELIYRFRSPILRLWWQKNIPNETPHS